MMDSIDYAQKLAKEFDVLLDDALKALDFEVDDLANDKFHSGRTAPYAKRLSTAYEHINEWLTNAKEYVVAQTYEDIGKFAFSHRRACVWAVLTVKARSSV